MDWIEEYVSVSVSISPKLSVLPPKHPGEICYSINIPVVASSLQPDDRCLTRDRRKNRLASGLAWYRICLFWMHIPISETSHSVCSSWTGGHLHNLHSSGRLLFPFHRETERTSNKKRSIGGVQEVTSCM